MNDRYGGTGSVVRPATTVLGIDVGGTEMKALLTGEGTPSTAQIERRPTPRAEGPDKVRLAIGDFAEHLCAQATDRGTPVQAVGVAVPGMVDEARGIVVEASNLGWHDVAIQEWLAERTGLPTVLSHDVRTAAVAEARLGAGRGGDVFFFMPIGTGIGGALVSQGTPMAGAQYGAGEIGHLVVRPDGTRCPCGAIGCLETVAAGWAIAARYAQESGSTRTVAQIVERLDTDPVADRVWSEAVGAMADGLAAVAMLLDPGVVVIGGGIAEAADRLFVPLQTELAARLTAHRPPLLVPAELGDGAGAVGATLLARDLAEESLDRQGR